MVEYLILGWNKAVPIIWESGRVITTPSQTLTITGVPNTTYIAPQPNTASRNTSITNNNQRVAVSFRTPTQPTNLPSGATPLPPALTGAAFWFNSSQPPPYVIELWNADSTGRPVSKIQDLITDAPFTAPYSNAPVLNWDTNYSIVLRPNLPSGSSEIILFGSSSTFSPSVWLSSNGGSSWSLFATGLISGEIRVQYALRVNYELHLSRPNEAANYYLNRSFWGASNPSVARDYVNGVQHNINQPLPQDFSGRYTYSADVATSSSGDLSLTYSHNLRYDKNPITMDMFNAVEAYLSRIEFLDTATSNSVELNDSHDQIFTGSGGTAITFDPMVWVWQVRVLTGRVRCLFMVFE